MYPKDSSYTRQAHKREKYPLKTQPCACMALYTCSRQPQRCRTYLVFPLHFCHGKSVPYKSAHKPDIARMQKLTVFQFKSASYTDVHTSCIIPSRTCDLRVKGMDTLKTTMSFLFRLSFSPSRLHCSENSNFGRTTSSPLFIFPYAHKEAFGLFCQEIHSQACRPLL